MKNRIFVLFAMVSLAGSGAFAQPVRGNSDGSRPPRNGPPHEQLFLTDKVLVGFINQLTQQMSEHYGFDQDQLWNVRAAIKDRFVPFIRENQDDLVKVINDYTGALLGDEPPSPAEVAEWAQRVQPLVEKFTGLVNDTTQEIRTYMTEEQQTKLDGEVAMFQVGINHLNNRLQVWADGGYDWESEWIRSEAFKRKQREREEALRREQETAEALATGKPDPHAGEPAGGGVATVKTPRTTTQPLTLKANDEWSAYVENFIKRYKLDKEQQDKARQCLQESQGQRDTYLKKNVGRLDQLQKRLNDVKTDEERTKIKADIDELNRPLDHMFKRLKDKLDPIPTRKQRAEAAQTEPTNRPKAETKPGDKR